MSPEIFLIINIHLLHAVIDSKLSGYDVPRHDVHLIVRLSEPKRMGTLADEMQVLRSTVTASADRLERGGLIRRRTDPGDRRACLLELSDAGREFQASVFTVAEEVFRSSTGLSDSEIDTFQHLMSKVRTHLIQTGFPEDAKK